MNAAFQVQSLNPAGKTKANKIAEAFEACLQQLEQYCPDGREMALVRTKLEEACFFATKTMASQPANRDK